MGFINVFKIEKGRREEFINKLHDLCGDPYKRDTTVAGVNFQVDLYIKNNRIAQGVGWEWVLQEFSATVIQKEKQAWAVLVAEVGETHYALTFGNAFYHVDKFSDKDFAFSIGRKFDYKQIKSTAQANPNSNRNKTVVSYIKSEKFEYDSGESFIKIKGKVKLAEGFTLFKENIEIGSSIKFDIERPTLDKCLQILLYLNELTGKDDITRIPIFVKVRDDRLKEELDRRLADDFKQGNFSISFSDFDIIGTQETFYSDSQSYVIKYGHKSKTVDAITEENIRVFCEEKGLQFNEVALSLRIVIREDDPNSEREIRQLIDYTNEEKQCVLLKGEWYQYNDDYLAELDASMDEFEIFEDERYDWTAERYQKLLTKKYQEEKDCEQYRGQPQEVVLCKLKSRYYSERAYNEYMATEYGYTLLDRKLEKIQDHKVEAADLYQDGCLIAVKIGNASAKLSYAVDQIDAAAKGVKKKALRFDQPFGKVAVLFVLERKNRLPVEAGKIKLRELKMLVLKNRLNEWKSEMRHLGLEPRVYIGYNDLT